jgi:hypothetical protein
MTTAIEAGIGLLDSELLPDIRAHADSLDRDEDTSRRSFAALGAAGLLGLGGPVTSMGSSRRWPMSSAGSPRNA